MMDHMKPEIDTNITIEGVSLKHFQVCFTIARTKGDMIRLSTCNYNHSHDDPGAERGKIVSLCYFLLIPVIKWKFKFSFLFSFFIYLFYYYYYYFGVFIHITFENNVNPISTGGKFCLCCLPFSMCYILIIEFFKYDQSHWVVNIEQVG